MQTGTLLGLGSMKLSRWRFVQPPDCQKKKGVRALKMGVKVASGIFGPIPCNKISPAPPPPLCDIPSGCCSFTGPWTVTRSSLRMLRRVAAFCRPLRPVLLLVSFPRSRSPVVGVLGLC